MDAESCARPGLSACDAQSYLVMAMAHHRLNLSDEAHVALGKACKIVETKSPKSDSGYLGEDWQLAGYADSASRSETTH